MRVAHGHTQNNIARRHEKWVQTSSSFFNFQMNIFYIVNYSLHLSKHNHFNRSANIPYKTLIGLHTRPPVSQSTQLHSSIRANRSLNQTFGRSDSTSERDKQTWTHSIRHSVLISNEPSPLRVCLSVQPHTDTRKHSKLYDLALYITALGSCPALCVRASAYLYWIRIPLVYF